MTPTRTPVIGREAQEGLLAGINIVADVVKTTLGPRGNTVLIGQRNADPYITKDGVTVAHEISLANKLHNLGAKLIKSVALKANDNAGDGTTTATVLAQAMSNGGFNALTRDANAVQVKLGLDHAVDATISMLRQISTPCITTADIARVGTISANGEESIGNMIADAMEKVGKDGVITIEEKMSTDKSNDDDVDIVKGMQFDNGYIHPKNCLDASGVVTYKDPLILLIDEKVVHPDQFLVALTYAQEQKRPIVIIAESFDDMIAGQIMVYNHQKVVEVVCIKAPGFGDKRIEYMDDIASTVGAKVVSVKTETIVGSLNIENEEGLHELNAILGTCESIRVENYSTTIIRGQSDQLEVDARIARLKTMIEAEDSEVQKEYLQTRLARLSSGVARIRVAGRTEVEVKERMDRVEDALNATRAAVEGGIIAGGGSSLVHVSRILGMSLVHTNQDQRLGAEIALKAMEAPLRQIVENCAGSPDVVINAVNAGVGAGDADNKYNFGYNALTDEYGNLLEQGVIDPTDVTCTALSCAASVAGAILTTGALLVEDDVVELPTPQG